MNNHFKRRFSSAFRFLVAIFAVSIGATAIAQSSSQSPRAVAARTSLGINLAGPADWNTELPFVDVFRMSRAWISQRKGAAWGSGPKLELDSHGWVKRLEPECFAETPLCTIDGGHYPSGDWTVLWKGSGKIELSKGKVQKQESGKMVINIQSSGGGFFLRIKETDPANPVRDIKVLMPGFTAEQEAENPWCPKFLELWQNAACIRFMDLQMTNNSQIQHWSERSTLEHATCSELGLQIELMCDLVNRLKCDAWFCIPHMADDPYVINFAKLVRGKLDNGRRVYLEYSNEVWNSQFSQHKYAAEQGLKMQFAEKPWEAAWLYYSYRSVEIFKLWEQNFGPKRLIRVLASQAANSYLAEQILSFKDAAKHADALAIAPYIACNVPEAGDALNSKTVSNWSLDQLFDYVNKTSLPESIRAIKDHQKLSQKFAIPLVCYEAGQHFVGYAGGENNEALTSLFQRANRDQRIGEIYRMFFNEWEKNSGGLLCYFSSTSQWTKHGSWGLLEYADSNKSESPKYQAVSAWAKKHPK